MGAEDLNGEGDTLDRLPVSWLRQRQVVPVPTIGIGPESEVHALFLVSEAVVGHDLNGDGDTLDSVALRVGP